MPALALLALALPVWSPGPHGSTRVGRQGRVPPEPRVASVCDLLVPDARTVVAADRDHRAHVSLDGGATWEAHDLHLWSRDMTVGANGVWWSLYHWRRMHGERSVALLAWSRNRGRVWRLWPP